MLKAPRRRPSLEALEDRRLPATFGLPWPDPQHLKLSFMPDGTPVGGVPSTLNQTLSSEMPTSAWQLDVLRAFQSWAVLGNINIGLVSDDGQGPGQPGPLQGDPGFGDIRIGARSLSNNTLALAVPFDLGNNLSGDVLLNNQATFGDGPTAPENLYSALLHEAGHVFGLPDNTTDPTSVMSLRDTGQNLAPSAADVAALQALYGPRAPDTQGNTTFATASPLAAVSSSFLNLNNLVSPTAPTVVSADISSLTDDHVYRVTDVSGDAFGVSLRTSGISLLTAQVTVYDIFGHAVASAAAPDPLHGDIAVSVPNPRFGETYFLKVQSAQANVFGIGSYRLAAGQPQLASQAVNTDTNADTFSNSQSHGMTELQPQTPGTDARWTDLVHGRLTSSNPADDYLVKPGQVPVGGAMLVTVWGSQPGGLAPQVAVFENNHNKPVAFQVVAADSASESVQVLSPTPGAHYIVEVSAANPSVASSQATGDYTLAIDFAATPVVVDTLASGTLSAAQSETFLTLNVDRAELFHFTLAADTTVGTALSMTVFAASKKPVEYLRAISGSGSSSGDVLLPAGKYTIRILGATRTGAPLPTVDYSLLGTNRSDPIGPSPIDPTLDPLGPPPDDGGGDGYDVNPSSGVSPDDYLMMLDPYSNPESF